MPRGTARTRIGRFATGWYATPESIARGLFQDWAERPEAIWILMCGRREWESETRRIGINKYLQDESGEENVDNVTSSEDQTTCDVRSL